MCMIRCTHSFKILINSEKIIKNNLLKIQAAFIKCQFTETKKQSYDIRIKFFIENFLLIILKSIVKTQLSFDKFRKLIMLLMWNDLSYINHMHNLKTDNIRNFMNNEKTFLHWFNYFIYANINLSFWVKILRKMQKSFFKLRALFRNLRSQINIKFSWKFLWKILYIYCSAKNFMFIVLRKISVLMQFWIFRKICRKVFCKIIVNNFLNNMWYRKVCCLFLSFNIRIIHILDFEIDENQNRFSDILHER